jgi:arylsulfatase B
MMTGKYPHTLGMHHFVVQANEAWGLGLNETLMSNYFQNAGYKTHLIGKWHLGHFQKKYTPTYRGFDSFFGHYNGLIDYFNFTSIFNPFTPGYDLRKNIETFYDVKLGRDYATDLFTDEAVNIIENHESDSKPLFLMLNHLAPHSGITNFKFLPKQIKFH